MTTTAPAFPELSREQLEALCLKQNGRVIALVAALELLMAAKASDTLYMDAHWAQARAAIAKAQG